MFDLGPLPALGHCRFGLLAGEAACYSAVISSNGAARLVSAQFTLPRNALVRFACALYPIFKFTVPLGQLLRHFVGTCRSIASDCGSKLYELADPKLVARHFQVAPR
jgi:hypothetical protein